MIQAEEIKKIRGEVKLIARMLHGFEMEGFHDEFVDRRLALLSSRHGFEKGFELKDAILNRNGFIRELLNGITVNVTELFRNPEMFKVLRMLLPDLMKNNHPLRIWHPGSSTGHEVYSMAIVLNECGLLKQSTIYGTDMSHKALESAKSYLVHPSEIQEGTKSYHEAGGTQSLTDYFLFKYDQAKLKKELRQSIQFGFHDLGQHPSFADFDLIMCRNLFIYYDFNYQQKLLEKCYQSLRTGGLLVMGLHEPISQLDTHGWFECLYPSLKIYRKN